MKKVNFTEMKNGTKEDYMFLDKLEKEYLGETADRILGLIFYLRFHLDILFQVYLKTCNLP